MCAHRNQHRSSQSVELMRTPSISISTPRTAIVTESECSIKTLYLFQFFVLALWPEIDSEKPAAQRCQFGGSLLSKLPFLQIA